MKKNLELFFCGTLVVLLATRSYCTKITKQETKMITKAFHTEDIISLFKLTPEEIVANTPFYIEQAKKIIDGIIAIPDNERTYANTARPLDEVCALSNLAIAQRVYEALELLHPDTAIRTAAHDAYITIQSFWVD